MTAAVPTCPRCQRPFEPGAQFCPFDGDALVESVSASGRIDPLLGSTLLGLFHLRAIAGRGENGTVYRAWQLGVERAVAVKVLHRELIGDRAVVRRFLREARAIARLDHPGIVSVHVLGQTPEGAPFIAMEYVDGPSLEQALVERDGPLPLDQAARIGCNIAEALAEAHAAGIVHRDLKPANVLLTGRRGSAGAIKLVDFGIAKVGPTLAGLPGDSRGTGTAGVFGTPHYIAPEQAAGETVDPRADIYSLGVILYRMVTGRVPFDGTGVGVLLAHLSRAPVPVQELAPTVPRPLADLILACMAKRPADRPASADAVAATLAALALDLAPSPSAATGALSPAAIADALARAATVDVGLLDALAASRDSDDALAPSSPEASGQGAWAGRLRYHLGDYSDSELPYDATTPLDPDLMITAAAETASVNSPPPRARLPRLRAVALAVTVAVAAFAAAVFAMVVADGDRPAGGTRPPAGAFPDAASGGAPIVEPGPSPSPSRTVVVAEDGYSLRVLIPQRLVIGAEYLITLEVWDPDGEPLATPELVITIDAPDGSTRGLAATPGAPGVFHFRRSFELSGRHAMRVFPPTGNATLHLFFDVVG